jgi:hypothetical protein
MPKSYRYKILLQKQNIIAITQVRIICLSLLKVLRVNLGITTPKLDSSMTIKTVLADKYPLQLVSIDPIKCNNLSELD